MRRLVGRCISSEIESGQHLRVVYNWKDEAWVTSFENKTRASQRHINNFPDAITVELKFIQNKNKLIIDAAHLHWLDQSLV